jgi:hypothetical protein
MDAAELLLLNEALVNLQLHDARKAELVKQWYFVGLTVAEVAATMGISVRTAERDWAYARAWLVREMDRLTAIAPAGVMVVAAGAFRIETHENGRFSRQNTQWSLTPPT